MENMLQIKFVRLVAVVVLCIFGFSGLSVAAEFSADFVVKAQGESDIVGKIFVKGNKVRQEMTEDGETQILIIRPDKNLTWMVTPEEKMYMEIPYQSDGWSFEDWSAEKEKNAKYLGEETVAGMPSKKYETVEDGEKTTFWVSKKLSFPIKVQDSETTMEYKNIKEGSIPDSQFEIPAGFEKMAVPAMPSEGGPSQ